MLAGAAAPGWACADVYCFVDENGVSHFSNVPSDHRYQLFIATPQDDGTATAKARGIDWLALSSRYDRLIQGAAGDATIQAVLVRAGARYLSDLLIRSTATWNWHWQRTTRAQYSPRFSLAVRRPRGSHAARDGRVAWINRGPEPLGRFTPKPLYEFADL